MSPVSALSFSIFVLILSCVYVSVNASLWDEHHTIHKRAAEVNGDVVKYAPKGAGDFVLPDGYSTLIPPPTHNGEPTKIGFSVIIMNIRDVHETNQELSIEMNLRVYWTDARLKNLTGGEEFLVLNPSTIQKIIWFPDVFIGFNLDSFTSFPSYHVKTINTPALLSKPGSIRLFEDGSVRFSTRITVVMSCQMNFRYYPADTQHCDFDLKSYAYPNNILVLAWHEGVSASFATNFTIPNFVIRLDSSQEFSTTSSSGVYSGIRFTISLKREMSYHLLQTYVPSTLFMLVSWLTFIIPQDSGAVAICMTTLLTTTAMFGAVRQNTPTVSYAKAIDIWMAVCVVTIFLSLIQHTVTLRMRHMKSMLQHKNKKAKAQARRQALSTHDQNDDPPVDEDPAVLGVAYRANGKDSFQLKSVANENDDANREGNAAINRRYAAPPKMPAPPTPKEDEDASAQAIAEYKVLANKIRKVFSLFIPTFFGVFNIIYWPWLLRSSGYLD